MRVPSAKSKCCSSFSTPPSSLSSEYCVHSWVFAEPILLVQSFGQQRGWSRSRVRCSFDPCVASRRLCFRSRLGVQRCCCCCSAWHACDSSRFERRCGGGGSLAAWVHGHGRCWFCNCLHAAFVCRAVVATSCVCACFCRRDEDWRVFTTCSCTWRSRCACCARRACVAVCSKLPGFNRFDRGSDPAAQARAAGVG